MTGFGLKLAAAAAAAMLLDALLGDPAWMPHPVILMGKAISRLEKILRKNIGQTTGPGRNSAGSGPEEESTAQKELRAGLLLAGIMTAGTLGISCGVLFLAGRLHPFLFWALEVFWGWQCLAMRGLQQEGENVRRKLTEGTLPEARQAVARIVGRDTDELSREGVVRAAVESVAENFSDGVLAPLLYFLIGGAPLALCYKAVNTMDSMVGYKNERYLHFGRAAARLDDAANLLPSRIAAILLILAAPLCKTDPGNAFRIWRRDRRKHASPNSAQTEAAMAGALGIRLGGPACYFGELHEKPTLGDPLREPVPEDIRTACRMMITAGILGLALLGGLRIFL